MMWMPLDRTGRTQLQAGTIDCREIQEAQERLEAAREDAGFWVLE